MQEQGPSGPQLPGRRAALVTSVAIGLVVALLALAAGAVVVLSRPTQWTSHTTLLVSPSASNSDSSTATLYELLTQGQVASTYAALLRNDAFGASLIETAGIAAPAQGVTVEAEVLPDTFLITVTTTAPTSRDALALARSAARTAPAFVDALSRPFSLRAIDAAAISATRSSNVTVAVLGVVVICALGLALLAQQVVYQLMLRHSSGSSLPSAGAANGRPGTTAAREGSGTTAARKT